MNKKQLIIMWIAIVITVAMVVYPPLLIKHRNRGGYVDYSISYDFIFSDDGQVDVSRLVIQAMALWLISAGFMLTPSGSIKWRKLPMKVVRDLFYRLPLKILNVIFSKAALSVMAVIAISAFLVYVIIVFLDYKGIWP